jgi:alpha-amylase/alpha-mannosidase (GH57 family)
MALCSQSRCRPHSLVTATIGMRYLCIHCHFYQPPRENPWLEQIELQDSAYPYHDWNERISAECYAPNLAARILDEQQRITRIVNNYSKISFDFGPTLLSWACEHAVDVYRGIIEADKRSQKLFGGHGSAMGQAYNHIIMPLANSRDKKTQIRWGVEDFIYRFGRMPEGMWLPETAVDLESLDLMAQAGMIFAVLAPHQAKAFRPMGDEAWQDVTGSKIDPSRPYLLKTSGGRSINLFFYDGPISQAVAFEKLLDNGEKFAQRLMGAYSDKRTGPQMSHIATDGETYGHHHKHGEMALCYALDYIESKKLAAITNYGQFLEQNPPTHEVQIYENTSWSCVHGVERWRSNCGCNSGRLGWNQEWRKPLREALDWLRDCAAVQFEQLGSKYLKDPWAARDGYIGVMLDRSPEVRERFGEMHFRGELSDGEQVQVWKLLELQRHALLMYTSCGWFFDELSGIETVQVIEYAGRVVQLAEQLFGDSMEEEFLKRLSAAKSNLPEYGDGARIYKKYVKPLMVDLEKVGAHYSISSLFAPYGERIDIFSYGVKRLDYHTRDAGRMRMAIGQARFTSKVTQECEDLTFWVVHFGDHNVAGGVRKVDSAKAYEEMLGAISDSFGRVDIPEVVRLLDKRFGEKTYSLRSLFRDEQRRIVRIILSSTVAEAEAAYLQLYEHHAALMRFINTLGTPMPREFTAAVEYAINSLLRRACASDELDGERIRNLLREAQSGNVSLDKTTLEFTLRRKIESLAGRFASDPFDAEKLDELKTALRIVKQMPFPVTVWLAQNHVYGIKGQFYEFTRNKATAGDAKAESWVNSFSQLCDLLMIRVE